jgi:hypothetical protein
MSYFSSGPHRKLHDVGIDEKRRAIRCDDCEAEVNYRTDERSAMESAIDEISGTACDRELTILLRRKVTGVVTEDLRN